MRRCFMELQGREVISVMVQAPKLAKVVWNQPPDTYHPLFSFALRSRILKKNISLIHVVLKNINNNINKYKSN